MAFVLISWSLSFAVCTLSASLTSDSRPFPKVLVGSWFPVGSKREGHECWEYSPFDGSNFALRADPTVAGNLSGHHLQAGEAFAVSAAVVGKDGVRHLKLSDGSGWASNVNPAFRRIDNKTSSLAHAGHILSRSRDRDSGCQLGHHGRRNGRKMQQLVLGSSTHRVAQSEGLWRYNPANGVPIAIRSEPSIAGDRTEHFLEPGEIFAVDRKTKGSDGVQFLRLSDGTGWVFEEDPAKGKMCEPASNPQEEHLMSFMVGTRRFLETN